MPQFGFIGPQYVARGTVGDCERWLNLCLEKIESGMSAGRPTRYQAICTPGKQLMVTLDDAPVACVVGSSVEQPAVNPTDPQYFAVSGSTLYATSTVFVAGLPVTTPVTIGTVDKQVILNTGGQLFPAQIVEIDPTWLFVVANGKAWTAGYGAGVASSNYNDGGTGYAVGDTGVLDAGHNDAAYVITSVTTGVAGSLQNTGLHTPGGAGTGYAVGDTGTITGGGGTGATYEIVQVTGPGEVTVFGYRITAIGSGYSPTVGATTLATSGAGSGLLIDIIAVGVSGGAVRGYTLTAGSAYTIATAVPTFNQGVQPGVGTGFTVDITALSAAAWILTPQPNIAGGAFIKSATFLDGYVIVSLAPNEPDPLRRQFFISALNNPAKWDPRDFATKEGSPDPIIAVYAAYEILILAGSRTFEFWQNSGSGLFPFQRLPGGGLIQNGLASTWAINRMDDGTICWLGKDERGGLVAWQLRGLSANRISNHALENTCLTYDETGASSYAYQENGHFYWVLNFPIPDITWVYDSSIGPELGWHQREHWDGSVSHADRGRYHGFNTSFQHVVGDYSSGNLYFQSLTILLDNCDAIRRIRVTPHLVDEKKWIFGTRVRMHMLTGVVPATGPGSNPVCNLRISKDGAQTWGNYLTMPLGQIGQYEKMVEWYTRVRARDLVFEWSCNEPIDIVLVEAYLEYFTGTG